MDYQNNLKLISTEVQSEYKQVTIYSPDWVIGDVFSHTLTYPTAKELGIMSWTILFLKVGEYVDKHKVKRQLMLVSLCPPDSVPSCYEELKKYVFFL